MYLFFVLNRMRYSISSAISWLISLDTEIYNRILIVYTSRFTEELCRLNNLCTLTERIAEYNGGR